MKKIEYKSFEIKALVDVADSTELGIEGYAAIFNTEDTLNPSFYPEEKRFVLAKDIIYQGAFTKTLSDRAGRIKFCKNHNIDNPIGVPVEIKEDETGLFTRSVFSAAERDLQTKVREGIFSEMSIGYYVTKYKFELKADNTYVRHIYEIKLIEYSIVTFGRHEGAVVTELKELINVHDVLETLIDDERNEEKKYKLMQLKSLIDGEPNVSLIHQEPKKAAVDFDKMNFLIK
jgi:HK97 family phage prohead protease